MSKRQKAVSLPNANGVASKQLPPLAVDAMAKKSVAPVAPPSQAGPPPPPPLNMMKRRPTPPKAEREEAAGLQIRSDRTMKMTTMQSMLDARMDVMKQVKVTTEAAEATPQQVSMLSKSNVSEEESAKEQATAKRGKKTTQRISKTLDASVLSNMVPTPPPLPPMEPQAKVQQRQREFSSHSILPPVRPGMSRAAVLGASYLSNNLKAQMLEPKARFPFAYLKEQIPPSGVGGLEFAGIEHVTDLVLQTISGAGSLITGDIDLRGCRYVTDFGISYLSKFLESEEKLSVLTEACTGLTDRCWRYLQLDSSLDKFKTVAEKMKVDKVLMTNYADISDFNVLPRGSDVKVVVSVPDDIEMGVTEFLATKQANKSTRSLTFFRYESSNEQSYPFAFNIFETKERFVDAFISDCCIVVLPFAVQSDVNAVAAALAMKITAIASQVPFASFLLVGVSEKGTSKDDVSGVTEATVKQVKTTLAAATKTIQSLSLELFSSLSDDGIASFRKTDSSSLGLREMRQCSHMLSVNHTLSALTSNDELIRSASIDTSASQSLTSYEKALHSCALSIKNRTPVTVDVVPELFRRIKRHVKPAPLQTRRKLIESLLAVDDLKTADRSQCVRCLEWLHQQGNVLYFSGMVNGPVSCDPVGLSKIVNVTLSGPKTPLTPTPAFVHPATMAWTDATLREALKDMCDQQQVDELVDILNNVDLIHTQYGEQGQRFHVVVASLKKPELSPFWTPNPEGFVFHSMTYHIQHQLSPAVMARVLKRMDGRSAVFVWNRGAVFQEHGCSLLVEQTSSKELTVSARTKEPPTWMEDRSSLDDALLFLFNEYKTIVLGVLVEANAIFTAEMTSNASNAEKVDNPSFRPMTSHVGENPNFCDGCGSSRLAVRQLQVTQMHIAPTMMASQRWTFNGTNAILFGNEIRPQLDGDVEAQFSISLGWLNTYMLQSVKLVYSRKIGYLLFAVRVRVGGELQRTILCDLANGLVEEKQQDGSTRPLGARPNVEVQSVIVEESMTKKQAAPTEAVAASGDSQEALRSRLLEDIRNHGKQLKATKPPKKARPDGFSSFRVLLRATASSQSEMVLLFDEGGDAEVISVGLVDETMSVMLSVDGRATDDNKHARVYIDATSMSPSAVRSDWTVGMRLEARDRKNPSLLAVANITDYNASTDMYTLNIDGWGTSYDYSFRQGDPDVHPAGWWQFVQQTHFGVDSVLNKAACRPYDRFSRFDAPRGFMGTFIWSDYLNSINQPPAPLESFTLQQTEGMTADYFPSNAGSAGMHQCNESVVNPRVLFTYFTDHFESNHPKSTSILWPKSMSRAQLERLPLAFVQDLQNQCTVPVCIGKEMSHLADEKHELTELNSATVTAMLTTVAHLITNWVNEQQEYALLAGTSQLLTDSAEANALPSEALEALVLQCLVTYEQTLFLWCNDRFRLCTVDERHPVGRLLQKNAVTPLPAAPPEDTLCSICAAFTKKTASMGLVQALKSGRALSRNISAIRYERGEPLGALPDDVFATYRHLRFIKLTDAKLDSLPRGIGNLVHLRTLLLDGNNLKTLPDDIAACVELDTLTLSGNELNDLPEKVLQLPKLKALSLNRMAIESLPETFGGMSMLNSLRVEECLLRDLPVSLARCTNLKTLHLSGVKWLDLAKYGGVNMILSLESVKEFFAKCFSRKKTIPEKEVEKLFQLVDVDFNQILNFEEAQCMNGHVFRRFPRFGDDLSSLSSSGEQDALGGIPPVLFRLENLTTLDLSFQSLRVIPDEIGALKHLEDIDVSFNPLLESVSAELGTLPLRNIRLLGCHSLKTPPKEIVRRGFVAVYSYLQRLRMGSVACRRTKLMLVGLGEAGKTSLIRTLTGTTNGVDAKERRAQMALGALTQRLASGYSSDIPAVTDGIDIQDWSVQAEGGDITFSAWDFAGQSVYYNTHQFFLTERAVYLLLWNIRLGYEHAGLEFWLSSLTCHAPKAPIFIVGTHCDQVSKWDIPMGDLKKRYPQIVSFHFISSLRGDGLPELRTEIIQRTAAEPYMGEKVPEVWLKFEGRLKKLEKQNLVEFKTVKGIALECGIHQDDELERAIQFLHDLGSIQYFKNETLKDKVVINPQWIVKVMSCIVSVHATPIKNGRLYYADIPNVWKEDEYDANLRQWLLRLTEQFELTYPMMSEQANLVPCLLPETPPTDVEAEFEADPQNDIRVTRMVYRFEYLPAGLFNRMQVRLYQFSDNAVMWSRGSVLQKNDHKALVLYARDSKVIVKVRGVRPENLLFLIHEVLEGLVHESFNGVKYDYQFPCPDCMHAGTYDPCLFPASRVRRASEKRVPFLQCDKNFHTVSMSELQSIMVPDNNQNYDLQLESTFRDLKTLKENLSRDVYISYCVDDLALKDIVAPRKIHDDLEKIGFKCWFNGDDGTPFSLEQEALCIRNSKLIIFIMSDNYASDKNCVSICEYARGTQKKYVLAVIGTGQEWKKTNIGARMCTEVYVNLTQPERYATKIAELIEKCQESLGTLQKKRFPPCFISYCWNNSLDAINKGTKQAENGIGWADPRELKQLLDKNGIKCWIDTEQVGKESGGLFEDIAEGLRHAKVVIACVSDQYVQSKNCQMEFRFARTSLNLPTIVATMGTSNHWKKSEIGMLALDLDEVTFQYANPSAYDRLLELVKTHVSTESEAKEDEAEVIAAINEAQQQSAYNELFQLAQRKFLRQMAAFAEQMEENPYPRLFSIDLVIADATAESDQLEQSQAATTEARADGVNEERPSTSRDNEKGETDPTKTDATPSTPATSRPTTGFRRPMTAQRAAKSYRPMFCGKLMCEYEEGWHICGDPIVLDFGTPADEQLAVSNDAPAYMARVVLLLKHSDIQLSLFATDQGESLIHKFNEASKSDSSSLEASYKALRSLLHKNDKGLKKGGLLRCLLPNGKLTWLCQEHQAKMRVTVMRDVDAAKASGSEEENLSHMMETIERLIDEGKSSPLWQAIKLKRQQQIQELSALPPAGTVQVAPSQPEETPEEKPTPKPRLKQRMGMTAPTGKQDPSSRVCVIM